MICLGVESTAHTFGIGIVKDSKVIANARMLYTTKSGGMILYKVADHHVENCDAVLQQALDEAGIELKDIDLISFSQGPGMGHCLRVGAFFARVLSLKLKVPLVGVNHCVAHLEIGKTVGASNPVLLYASGVNTQVIALEGGKYRIFGETLDIGVGNFLDSVGRAMNVGFPGGPEVEKLALKGKLIDLPYVVKGMDVSFGGLLTNIKQKLKNNISKEDLCFSLQETAFAMLIEVSERAMAHCEKKELLLGGGVACNKRLQEMAKIMCKARGAKCFILPNSLNIDNGAMIAYLGLEEYKAGKRQKVTDTSMLPYWRTDDVDVFW